MGERHTEPRNGAKEFLQRRFFRPVPGLVNWLREPTAHAVGYVVSPSGLGALVAAMPLCGAANPGCRRLSAGACRVRRLAATRKSRLEANRPRGAGPYGRGTWSACGGSWQTDMSTGRDRKSTRLNSSHRCISYAV